MPVDWLETGRLVRELRTRAGLSQAALGRQLGMSTRAVSLLEAGLVVRPTARLMDAVRQLLGAEPPAMGEPGAMLTPRRPRQTEIRRVQQDVASLAEIASPDLWASLARIIAGLLGTARYERDRARQENDATRSQHLDGEDVEAI